MTLRQPETSRHARRGLTLLEAVLALIILSAVLTICLQVRVQGIRHRASLARLQQQDQAVEALFQQLIHNLLPGGVTDESGALHWEGEHLGRPYTVARRAAVVANPVQQLAGADASPTVRLFEYTITWDGHATSFNWHR